MSNTKAKVRKGTLFNRRLLAEEVWSFRCSQVNTFAFKFVVERGLRTVHLFLPILKNREIDTWPLLETLTKSGVEVVLSHTDFDSRKMTHYRYTYDLKFEEDQFGIPTPVSGQAIEFSEIDLVFIPLLAADKKGNRIGYGKGFYDQLLSAKNDLLKVGLSISPMFDSFPFRESHDVRLDYLISHRGVYKCND